MLVLNLNQVYSTYLKFLPNSSQINFSQPKARNYKSGYAPTLLV
ncbi:hypothetical protein CAMRE0001_2160 [Campylobacter rectus RM3267]|uniref:Uncharacterized protein n=1 Tax=Campylobacter rectus RM3267 TaxID=553218 RepID=B9D464_CAMRE|nr:hypothetical protein CAMRE0001_2160 [Campylobacter rectus RM3267]